MSPQDPVTDTPMFAVDIEASIGELELKVKLPPAEGTTVIVGPNGAGKSTLLLCLLGAIELTRGKIVLGESVTGVPMEERKLGYVPQRYALFPHMNVSKNVGFGVRDCSQEERDKRVSELLGDLGIAHLADRMPNALSGGESQRVALARALAIRPRALLLDEPTAALDAGARKKVRQFIAERLKSVNVPTVVVSHDVEEVEAFGGRIAVIESGRIVQVGDLSELRANPATEFIKEFLGAD